MQGFKEGEFKISCGEPFNTTLIGQIHESGLFAVSCDCDELFSVHHIQTGTRAGYRFYKSCYAYALIDAFLKIRGCFENAVLEPSEGVIWLEANAESQAFQIYQYFKTRDKIDWIDADLVSAEVEINELKRQREEAQKGLESLRAEVEGLLSAGTEQ